MKKNNLIKEKKQNKFLTTKKCNFAYITTLFTMLVFQLNCHADALTTAQSLLNKACVAGGGLWAIWGLVQLGMSIKDHNGPGIQSAIWQIIGGGIVIAAGAAILALDLSMAV